jgi:hypothetical protein
MRVVYGNRFPGSTDLMAAVNRASSNNDWVGLTKACQDYYLGVW